MMKHIAVLITVHNRKKQTLQCLENLFKQELPNGYVIRVYLTDDGCTDGTAQAVLEQYRESVCIIQGDGNLYWNRGMWKAWNKAASDGNYSFFLWLNDDTNLEKGALLALINTSEKYSHRSIIVGATTDTATHQVLTYGGRLQDGTIPLCQGEDSDVHHFNGNIVLVPDSVYKVIGNLDYYFTHSKGDFDYGLRAHKAGIRLVQCGIVLGWCDVHPTTDKWCDPRLPLSTRIKSLRQPNGMPPKETFHLNRRHYGLRSAIIAYITIHLRCLFPMIWVKLGKLEIK